MLIEIKDSKNSLLRIINEDAAAEVRQEEEIDIQPLVKVEPDEEEQNHLVNWLGDYEERDTLVQQDDDVYSESNNSSSSTTSSSSSEDDTPRTRVRRKYRKRKDKTRSDRDYSLNETIDDQRIRETANMQCEYCMKGLSNFREVKIHYKEEHGVSGYIICCGKRFKQKCRLVDHVSKHYDLSYECHTCQKSFDSKTYLIKHLACHDNEKQYVSKI